MTDDLEEARILAAADHNFRQLGSIIMVLRKHSGGSQRRDDSKAVWRWRAEQAVGSQKGD